MRAIASRGNSYNWCEKQQCMRLKRGHRGRPLKRLTKRKYIVRQCLQQSKTGLVLHASYIVEATYRQLILKKEVHEMWIYFFIVAFLTLFTYNKSVIETHPKPYKSVRKALWKDLF